MGNALHKFDDTVEEFPHSHNSRVTDELNRIMGLLRVICPQDAQISFNFEGRLQVHIDVRKREELYVVEAVLPTLEAGLFHSLSRGRTPHHPFFQRLSAVVRR
jgi:hypothetical protein